MSNVFLKKEKMTTNQSLFSCIHALVMLGITFGFALPNFYVFLPQILGLRFHPQHVLQSGSSCISNYLEFEFGWCLSCRYGEQAGHATSEGLDAAGHAIGTGWAAFKIRKAFNPKSVLKPTTLAKTAAKAVAAERKAKISK